MTVRELIIQLQCIPNQDLPVTYHDEDGYTSIIKTVKFRKAEDSSLGKDNILLF